MIVKPDCVPCQYTKSYYAETLLIDNGEFLTLFVGHKTPTDWLNEIFGVADYQELRTVVSQSASFAPSEGESAQLLNSLIEQIRYERTDGPTLPTRVVLYGTPQSQSVQATCFVEDSPDSVTEFDYKDFLTMIHKRIQASTKSS